MRELSDFEKRARDLVIDLWHCYFQPEAPDTLEKTIMPRIDENILVIGSGRHEVYENKEEFYQAMALNRDQSKDIDLDIIDEWSAARAMGHDTCLVYGRIWVREKDIKDKAVFVEMNSRFTVVCKQISNGEIMICSLHHSLPFIMQVEGDQYPRSISAVAKQAIRQNPELLRRLELDPLTQLYNRVSVEKYISSALGSQIGTFYAIDLDNFKEVNDTLGHLMGDKVIKEFSILLRNVFGENAIIGRMGGDEYAVWHENSNREKEEALVQNVLKKWQKIGDEWDVAFGCSIGATMVTDAP